MYTPYRIILQNTEYVHIMPINGLDAHRNGNTYNSKSFMCIYVDWIPLDLIS